MPRLSLFVALAVSAVTTLARLGRILFRNTVWGQPYTIASVDPVRDAIRLQLKVPRPWTIQPGQYIYLWMPSVSFWSIFQSHAFMISWWDENPDGEGYILYLLVKQRSGFSQKLLRHVDSDRLKAWIDGPYGEELNVADYGDVLMFASGIGVAAQMPYLKTILASYNNYRACTKNILLTWQLDKESV